MSKKKEGRGGGIISLDPGERVFFTDHDPSGLIVEWGINGMNQKVFNICDQLDQLQSLIDSKKIKHRKRYKLKKVAMRKRKKIRNFVDDCHRKAIKWLCSNYNVILLLIYETSNMADKKTRKIGKKTTRGMYTWSHYRFKMNLKNKAKLYPNCKVAIVDESYSSVTCTKCGFKNESTSNKTFHCKQCDFKTDRDWNGGRNILIKRLNSLFP
jgi:putative transposase